MYKCYLNDELLYTPELDEYKLSAAKLSVELNKTGSFKFTIYPDNPRYSFIKKRTSIVTIYNEDSFKCQERIL